MGRLEGDLAETKIRIRRKDDEHASALGTLERLKEERERVWSAERRSLIEAKEHAAREIEERNRTVSDLQGALDATRAENEKLRSELAAVAAERGDLQKKLAATDAKLQSLKGAEAQLRDFKQHLQEARTKATGLQSELEKRDQRIKDLQLLIKTLGERLNDLADRRR
jgi:chromosome segregation ATPase